MVGPQIYAGLTKKQQFYARHGIIVSCPKGIIETVCQVLRVTHEDIIGKKRIRFVVEARHIAIGLISVAQPDMTLKKIGSLFGYRDHSTIIYSKKNFFDLYFNDKKFKDKVDRVKEITNIE